MILTIINIGASIQHKSSQRLIAVKIFDKLLWKLKAFCVLLRMMNDNRMITNQMNFPSTIPLPKGSWAEESTPINWNLSWILWLFIPLVMELDWRAQISLVLIIICLIYFTTNMRLKLDYNYVTIITFFISYMLSYIRRLHWWALQW